MFIAHLPAGYIAGTLVERLAARFGYDTPRRLTAVTLLASVLPDFDLLWFYLVDQRQHLHHTYWTHIPVFWVALGIVAALIALAIRRRDALPYIGAVTLGTLLHIVLDTVAGGIHWLYPLSSVETRWVEVPSVYGWWIANFVLHWSFALELILLGIAIWLHPRFASRVIAFWRRSP